MDLAFDFEKPRSKDRSLRQLLQRLGAFSWRLVGCQAAIASRLTPTVGLGAFSWRLVGCQAAIASRLTPTEKQKPTARSSPLNRMSVSSAAALDLKGPFGRLSGGVYPGVGAQRPFGEAKHIERRCSEANRRRCPRMNPVTKEPEPRRGPNAGAQRFGYFLAFEKVTRCKSGTASGSTQNNGYSQRTTRAWSARRPPRKPQIKRSLCEPGTKPHTKQAKTTASTP